MFQRLYTRSATLDRASAPLYCPRNLRGALHPSEPPSGLGLHCGKPRLRLPVRTGVRNDCHRPHRHSGDSSGSCSLQGK